MEQKNIAVLFGGQSAEYVVSLQSAHAVIRHMDTERYRPIPVGITREGRWLRFAGDPERILHDTWHEGDCTPAYISPCRGRAGLVEQGENGTHRTTPLDGAFPVMHGTFGEDGRVQGLLELAGIPIVGCGSLASALCMDKHRAHTLVAAEGILVPASCCFARGTAPGDIRQAAGALGYPLFVKPVCAGSSFGVTRVEAPEELEAAVTRAFAYDDRILLEAAIQGFEVGCAVLGNEELVLGELDEVELAGGFFDYTEKYNLITSQIHVPARIAPRKTAQMKEVAAAIYKTLGCADFARVDMFLQPDGSIFFNEVNTIPGFTAHSRYPGMMERAGIGFSELVGRLVEGAVGP